jgi:hypothetical protein
MKIAKIGKRIKGRTLGINEEMVKPETLARNEETEKLDRQIQHGKQINR